MAREQRARRDRRPGGKSLKQLPWRQYRNPYKPIEAVSEDQLEAIHQASLRILEEMGIDFLDADARLLLKEKGADVVAGSERVRFDRAMIAEYVAKAPSEFTLHARNPEHSLIFGKDYINFGSVASAPMETRAIHRPSRIAGVR